MRYKEFIEGVRMGARDLAVPPTKQYTIGFEFEVAVDSDYVDDHRYSPSSYDDDDYGDDANDAWEEFTDNWYSQGHSTFDFEDWFKDTYLGSYGYQKTNLLRLINDNDINPRYDMVPQEVQVEFQNRKEQQRLERVKDSLGNPALYNKVLETLENFKKDPSGFSQNMKSVVDFVYVYNTIYKDDFSKSKESIEQKANDIIEQNGYEALEATLTLYYDLLKKNFTFNQANPEDYEESLNMIYADKERTDVVELDEIHDVEDFTKYFDVSVDDLRDYTENQWTEAENEVMSQEFEDWYANRDRRSVGSKIGYVTSIVNDEFNTSASSAGSGKSHWAVIPDGTPGVDAEITTPAFPIDKGITVMKKMLNIIGSSGYIQTKSATGLHVNIGTFTEEEANSIDWLKFLMIMNAERVLQRFDRVHNTYAPDQLPKIIDSLQKDNVRNYVANIQRINSIVRSISGKYSALNLSKLRQYGIIELRAPGNAGYETQIVYLEETIKRIVRALELASDPNKYKNEYLSMLYKRFGKKEQPVNAPAIKNYFNKTFGIDIGVNNFITAIDRVIEVGARSTPGMENFDPNVGYTISVNKELLALLKSYIDAGGNPARVTQVILDALAKYDKNNIMRSSNLIRFLLKSLSNL